MRRKVVTLQDSMLDENKQVIFVADVPYEVEFDYIENTDDIRVRLHDIWVDYNLTHHERRY